MSYQTPGGQAPVPPKQLRQGLDIGDAPVHRRQGGELWANDLVLFLKGLLGKEGTIWASLGAQEALPAPSCPSEPAVGKTVSDGRGLEGGRTG